MSVAPADPRAGGELRDRILAAATRLFAEQGVSATSVRQVVEACECTKPALYHYFASKESLLREVVQLHIVQLEQMIRHSLESPGPIRERTHRSIAALLAHAEANPYPMRLLQRIELQPEEGVPATDIMATRELHLQMVSSLIAQGIAAGEVRRELDPRECALVLAGTVSFQLENSLASGVWFADQVHRTIDLVFDGISA